MKDITDIEDIVSIKDFSLYIDFALVALSIVMIYFIFKFYKKKKNRPLTKKELALKAYKSIDFTNPKRASYLITKYGYVLSTDKKSQEIFKELMKDLTRYKYKKNVDDFDDKTIGLYNLFLEVVTNE